MTESNPMLQEMIRVKNSMTMTSMRTKNKFDDRMRVTVKDLLDYHYAMEGESIELVNYRRDFMQVLERADILTDWIFRVNSSRRRQFMKNAAEWNGNRPIRIFNYLEKLVDIFPPEHLIDLLSSSLKHGPEEIISIYEANKGEAKLSDYGGEPTGIDLTAFKIKVNFIHKI